MFTPRRNSPAKGSPFVSPYERSTRSPFGQGGSVTRSGRPRARPSPSIYESGLVSGKIHASSFTLEEAATHKVISYGQTLPVQVTEALSRRSPAPVSCQLDPSGWAWLVNRKQLLIWKYVPSVANKTISCCELCLPTSELHHKAKLTCIIPADSGDNPYSSKDVLASVINVSPEGIIRFWPNISTPGLFVEASAGHKGKEFHTLAPLPPHGYALLTSDGEILLVRPNQTSIICRSISESAGLLSGIGRRMSSFLLGSQSPSENLHSPILVVGPGGIETKQRHFYVLTNGNLQKWEIMDGKEKLLSQVDLLEKLNSEVFNVLGIDPEALVKIKPLDITSTGYCIAVLASAVIRTINGLSLVLLLGTIQSSGKDFSHSFESLIPIEQSADILDENDIPEFELLIPPGRYQAFIFNKNIITANPVSEVKSYLAEVKFPNDSAKVVGGGSYGTDAVFLSRRHGLFSVIAYYKDSPSSVLQINTGRDTTSAMDSVERDASQIITQPNEDLKDSLTRAFYKHSEGNTFEANEIVSMISSEDTLDEAVVAIGKEIVDAIPASDPRWAQHSTSSGQASTDSVLILRQLEDKARVFDFFLKFLNSVEIFDKLTTCQANGEVFYTKFRLCEQAEKLSAAQALQMINLKEDNFVQHVIKAVVENRIEDSPGNHLTYQDIFFREVTRIQELFPTLIEHEDNVLTHQTSVKKQIDVIIHVNNILISALKDAWLYRQSKASFYQPNTENMEIIEYIPWTAKNDQSGLRSVLKKQIEMTVDKALVNTDNTVTSKTLLQQMVDLSDLLLDGYITQLQFLKATKNDCSQLQFEFENERKSVLDPLIDQEHYKMALALAEKYEDFAVMIKICEKEGNYEKIEKYKMTLADKGFLDFLFKWYLDKGEIGKLLSQGTSPQLETFLSSHHHLSWLHLIGTGEFEKASEILRRSARNESTFLARKKTMLSIGKLCLLASEEDVENLAEDLGGIQNELDVILHQETLPALVVENSGIEANEMPPLSVEDLIELYTGDKNTDADEYDFKRALDLVEFVEPFRRTFLWNNIWYRSILKDNWVGKVPTNPLAKVQDTVFYRCAKLFSDQTSEIQNFLPSFDVLQSSEELRRRGLTTNDNFVFLMKAFYESIALG